MRSLRFSRSGGRLAALLIVCCSARVAGALDPIAAQMDTNHDGRISDAEVGAFASGMFKQSDTNGDGRITTADFMGRATKATIKKLPTLADHLPPSLASAAADGKVTKGEFMASRPAHAQAAAQAASQYRGIMTVRTVRPEVVAAYAQVAERDFQSLDRNHDGVITMDDFVAPVKKLPPLPPLVNVVPPWLKGAVVNDAVTAQAFYSACRAVAQQSGGTGTTGPSVMARPGAAVAPQRAAPGAAAPRSAPALRKP